MCDRQVSRFPLHPTVQGRNDSRASTEATHTPAPSEQDQEGLSCTTGNEETERLYLTPGVRISFENMPR